MSADGVGGNLSFLAIAGQEETTFPDLGREEDLKALALQFQAQFLQMGELTQGFGNIDQSLRLSLRR